MSYFEIDYVDEFDVNSFIPIPVSQDFRYTVPFPIDGHPIDQTSFFVTPGLGPNDYPTSVPPNGIVTLDAPSSTPFIFSGTKNGDSATYDWTNRSIQINEFWNSYHYRSENFFTAVSDNGFGTYASLVGKSVANISAGLNTIITYRVDGAMNFNAGPQNELIYANNGGVITGGGGYDFIFSRGNTSFRYDNLSDLTGFNWTTDSNVAGISAVTAETISGFGLDATDALDFSLLAVDLRYISDASFSHSIGEVRKAAIFPNVGAAYIQIQIDSDGDGETNYVINFYNVSVNNFNLIQVRRNVFSSSIKPLFTAQSDTVNFNSLTLGQNLIIQEIIDNHQGSIYNGLGGADVVTLPSKSNFNINVGGDDTLNWSSDTPFQTDSRVGDVYTIDGSDGDYNIKLGFGTDNVVISGEGKTVITAGMGIANIFINGTAGSVTQAIFDEFMIGDTFNIKGFVANFEYNSSTDLYISDTNGRILNYKLSNTAKHTNFIVLPGFTSETRLIVSERPSVYTLAILSSDVYHMFPSGISGEWIPILTQTDTSGEFSVEAYKNADQTQVVIAFRGTNFGTKQGYKQLLTDLATIALGQTTIGFDETVGHAARFLADIKAAFPSANITLTGHSLGGAIAEIVGDVSNTTTAVFNAPGSGQLLLLESENLNPASMLDNDGDGITNYRTIGDLVSLDGIQIGTVKTIKANPTPLYADTVTNFLNNHSIATVESELASPYFDENGVKGGPTLEDGVVEGSPLLNFSEIILPTLPVITRTNLTILTKVSFEFTIADAILNATIDPSAGSEFTFSESSNSPRITSVTFFALPQVASYKIWNDVNGVAGTAQTVGAGIAISFGSGTDAFSYEALDFAGNVLTLGSGSLFEATFASSGSVSATLTGIYQATATRFDFNGDGLADILWHNASGAISLWNSNGSGGFAKTASAGAPTNWSVAGVGDFNGDGLADILWHNTSGAISLWDSNGSGGFAKTASAGAPTNWSVAGVGDFNGDGLADILWHNTSGAISLWDSNGSGGFAKTASAGAPTNWSVAGVGDFNGDGLADILWHNTSGAISLWDSNGSGGFAKTASAGAPTNWSVAGVGDFNGDGLADILWHNTSGAISLWDSNGSGGFAKTASAGAPTNWSVAGVGDFNGDGLADILWHNASGAISLWDSNGSGGFAKTALSGLPTSWTLQSR